jgi:hypothetical protein
VNPTRETLQRVATHILARARFAATGKFGLRARMCVAGTVLVREREGRASVMSLLGTSLADLAAFAGADLSAPFTAGEDSPAVGDPDEPLTFDEDAAALLADWWHLGWRAIDSATADATDAMAIQLWPEHFDAGTSVAIGAGENDRCNLGASPGDSYSDDPYLYVGPWSDARPSDASYWNAPFGAVLLRNELLAFPDPYEAGVAFLRRGLDLLRSEGGHPH